MLWRTATEGLNDLVLLASVVTHGSFSGVARAPGIPKSRIGRCVADPETRLGVRLLQRSTHAAYVMDVGSVFFMHCESMTQAARTVLEMAEYTGEKPSGHLRTSCPADVAHVFIAPVLSRFLRIQPDVCLGLDVTNCRVDVIGDSYDMTLRARPTLDDSNLVVRSLGVSDQVLVASPSFIAEHEPFETPESMRGMIGVGVDDAAGERTRWYLTAPEGGAVGIEYTPMLMTDDLYLIGRTVLADIGVMQLPFNLCAEPVRDDRLVILPPGYRLPVHQFHVVFPSRRGLVPAVRVFIESPAEELPGMTVNVGRCYEDAVWQPGR